MAAKKKATGSNAPSVGMVAEDRTWRARDDLRTLTQAHEINSDRSRLAAAKREAAKQHKVLTKVARLGNRKI